MKDLDDYIALFKQFIKFGIVGVSNTAISLLVYYFFIWLSKDLYIVGNTVGFTVSVFNAYYWNNKYVFQKGEEGHVKPLLRTFAAYGMTFLMSTGLLYLWVDVLGVSEVIAPIISLLITIPMNFLLNKFWTFK